MYGSRPDKVWPVVRTWVAAKPIRRLKDQPQTLTGPNWRVSTANRIGAIDRFIAGCVIAVPPPHCPRSAATCVFSSPTGGRLNYPERNHREI
jgi:hypothetical protein